MVRGDKESLGYIPGGILSLAEFVKEHREALDVDLLRMTGYDTDDIGCALSWRTLLSVLNHLNLQSVTMQEINPEYATWASPEKTNGILADIYDILAVINANLVAIGSGKRPKQPKPYPRPGKDKDNKDVKHFGKDAVTVEELEAFFERKRKRHGKRT